MKKLINLVLTASSFLAMTIGLNGCFLLKEGETISWDKVNHAANSIKIAAQVTTYGVCQKNNDLKPVFKAIGEGLIVISGNNEQQSPEQIKSYIKSLFDKNKGWGEMGDQVNYIIELIIMEYSFFYTQNKDKFKDEVNAFAKLVEGIGKGFIDGSNLVEYKDENVGSSIKYQQQNIENQVLLKLRKLNKNFAQ
jgi:hypothetical protein